LALARRLSYFCIFKILALLAWFFAYSFIPKELEAFFHYQKDTF